MIHRKHVQRLSGSLVMSSFMSMSLSGVFSFLEFGLSLQWLQVWGHSILIALPIAFSLDMVFGDKLRLLSGKLADKAASAWP
ncbi:DUF2798 domain-containing protein [Mameliella sp. CS4]|uniref:DUF2798 domain-containing protein n=1 Tax=Mameliella sp. CS4 TaxID=2862329 RepID=UPI001C5CD6A9|nr:DUF2798 domain-containing protein [Mameliella sp. CS4]MBW4984992.1 DUF2798 domain-containing protein [Mameliella sp. CS4]